MSSCQAVGGRPKLREALYYAVLQYEVGLRGCVTAIVGDHSSGSDLAARRSMCAGARTKFVVNLLHLAWSRPQTNKNRGNAARATASSDVSPIFFPCYYSSRPGKGHGTRIRPSSSMSRSPRRSCRARHALRISASSRRRNSIRHSKPTHYSTTTTDDKERGHGHAHGGLPQYNRAAAKMRQLAYSPESGDQD